MFQDEQSRASRYHSREVAQRARGLLSQAFLCVISFLSQRLHTRRSINATCDSCIALRRALREDGGGAPWTDGLQHLRHHSGWFFILSPFFRYLVFSMRLSSTFNFQLSTRDVWIMSWTKLVDSKLPWYVRCLLFVTPWRVVIWMFRCDPHSFCFKVARRLSQEAKPAAVYSSDLKRAAETAKAIAASSGSKVWTEYYGTTWITIGLC